MNRWLKPFCAALSVLCIASAAQALENGVYRDKAPGYGGDVIVTVTVRNGRIDSMTTENTGGAKSEYYLKAEEELTRAIIAANGLDGVDAVAGATGTSESILTAMRGILEQAAYTGKENAAPNTSVQNGAKETVHSVKEATLTPKPHQVI